VANEWNGWEHQAGASLKKGYVAAESHFLEAKLDGASKRDLQQALVTLARGDLDPMTMEYVQIRFTDEDVAQVRLEPRGNVLHSLYPRFKLQALLKIDGQWKAVEDWSAKEEVTWCREKRAERIQELVLIYSNSHAGDQPFERDPPAAIGLFDEDSKLPRFEISNGSCMPWHGTTSVTVKNSLGGIVRSTADVTFKLFEGEGDDDAGDSPLKFYQVDSGTATTEAHWIDESGCTQDIDFVEGPIEQIEGRMSINFESRIASGGGISTLEGPTNHRAECPGSDPIVVAGPAPSAWMKLPLTGAELGEDGHTLKGSSTEFDASTQTTTISEWNLSSKREE